MNRPPRGVWYEASNQRWRVRRYRNRKAFLVGYFDTLAEALSAHSQLDTQLQTIPQRKRADRTEEAIPVARFSSLLAIALAQEI